MEDYFSSSFTTETFAMQLANILKTNQFGKTGNFFKYAKQWGREKVLNSLKEENSSTLLQIIAVV